MTALAVLALLSCGATSHRSPPQPPQPEPGPEPSGRLSFEGIALTEELERTVVPVATATARIGGQVHPIDFHVLGRSGQGSFGVAVDESGALLGQPCHDQDFNSLLSAHGQPFLISHFECTPGSAYVSRLAQGASGELSVLDTAPVDWSGWGGLWFPCAGQVTSWGTHLGSEEYEPNAWNWGRAGAQWDPWGAWEGMGRYWTQTEDPSPYLYGWITEVEITDAQGSSRAIKHGALGRFSHELGFVVGDDRTVYLSDDGSAVGWFMFVADAAGDLSAGTLYAARFSPRVGSDGLQITWISLGHATDAQIRAAIDARITLDDLFQITEPSPDGSCPEGSTWTHHSHGVECLRLAEPTDTIEDPAVLASRLETRRYAAMLGASTELEKAEGVTWDPDSERVYLAVSKVDGRMRAEPGAGQDHLALQPNRCGGVWGGDTAAGQVDADGVAIDSELVMTSLAPVLSGRPLDSADPGGNTCAVDGLANPDNITLLPGHGLMMIGEDTSQHRNNVLWAYDLETEQLTRVLAAPRGGEVTGIYWVPDLGGFGYLTVAVQHPWAELPEGEAVPEFVTDEDLRSFTGYLGPFPRL